MSINVVARKQLLLAERIVCEFVVISAKMFFDLFFSFAIFHRFCRHGMAFYALYDTERWAIKQRGFLAGLASLRGRKGHERRARRRNGVFRWKRGRKKRRTGAEKTFRASACNDLNCWIFIKMFFSSRCSSISSMLHFFGRWCCVVFFCTTFSLLPANKRFSISPEKCSNARGRLENKRRAQQGLEISRGTIINALKVISGSIPWPRKKSAADAKRKRNRADCFGLSWER